MTTTYGGNTNNSLNRQDASNKFVFPAFMKEFKRRTVIESYGELVTMSQMSGSTFRFQEYDLPTLITGEAKTLAEGTPPDPTRTSKRMVSGQLVWFGNYVAMTDQLQMLNEDGWMATVDGAEGTLAELAAMERARYCFTVLSGATNRYYANGSQISDVNTPPGIAQFNLIERNFDFNADGLNARPITAIVNSSVEFGTVSIMPAFVVVIHPHLRWDMGQLPGFVEIADYPGNTTLLPGEIGKFKRFRVVMDDYSTVLSAAGAAAGGIVINTGGQADVYISVVLSQKAFRIVPLQGMEGAKLIYKDFGSGGTTDPLDQFATLGYKNCGGCIVTHQNRLALVYSAATLNPTS